MGTIEGKAPEHPANTAMMFRHSAEKLKERGENEK